MLHITLHRRKQYFVFWFSRMICWRSILVILLAVLDGDYDWKRLITNCSLRTFLKWLITREEKSDLLGKIVCGLSLTFPASLISVLFEFCESQHPSPWYEVCISLFTCVEQLAIWLSYLEKIFKFIAVFSKTQLKKSIKLCDLFI